MPATTQERYRPDETVVWSTVENQTRTERRVQFLGYVTGGGSALVSFGVNAEGQPVRYNVPLRELSRPQPASNRPWYMPPGGITPPKPAQPLTATQVENRLTQRREALAKAHHNLDLHRQATAAAKEIADRAAKECDQARAALARLEAGHSADLAHLEEALRAGKPPDAPRNNGVDRGY